MRAKQPLVVFRLPSVFDEALHQIESHKNMNLPAITRGGHTLKHVPGHPEILFRPIEESDRIAYQRAGHVRKVGIPMLPRKPGKRAENILLR